ncbi:MAG: GDSL-type esterase/lipase family protein [Vitreoscilla sp.]
MRRSALIPRFGKAWMLTLASAVSLLADAAPGRVDAVAAWPEGSVALAARPVGLVEREQGASGWRYRWPGTYFEARFAGTDAYVDLGAGDKHARVSIDGREVADLVRPQARLLHIHGLPHAEHTVRVDVVSESDDHGQTFGGFGVPSAAAARVPHERARAIEFVGDSWTLGYGAGSGRRECSEDEVWRSTDSSLAFGPQVAHRFDADYRLLAISGRGMVRNFSNGAGDTLPQAWERLPADAEPWSPQLVVIGLGTNDFSTPVGPAEPWRDTADLSAAFERRYVAFVRALHGRHPSARFLLIASGAGDGAAERAVRRVRAQLAAAGLPVGDVVVTGALALDACNWHPSRIDQQQIARHLAAAVEAVMPDWRPSSP